MFRPSTFRVLLSPFRSSSFKHIHTSNFKHIRSPLTLQSRAFSSPQYPTGLIDSDPADNPNEYDVLISDIDYLKLNGEVSKLLDHHYLSRVLEIVKPKREVHGIVYGFHRRLLFTLITTYEHRSYYVHWLYDTGSPYTYLSYDGCNKLFGSNPVPERFSIFLNGHPIPTQPPPAGSHFKDINIIGSDFCDVNHIAGYQDYRAKEAKLIFKNVPEENGKGA